MYVSTPQDQSRDLAHATLQHQVAEYAPLRQQTDRKKAQQKKIVNHVALIAATLVACREDNRSAS
jgi:hypothetical protein